MATTITTEINLDTLIQHFGHWDISHQWLVNFFNEKKDEIKTGVEIGVAFGGNMNAILEGTEIEILYGVDPYEKERSDLHQNMDEVFGSYDGLYAHVNEYLKKYGTRAKLIRMTSEKASKKFKNQSLDFVFIDGDHLDVHNDVKYWESKVRVGGYIMGHDWNHPGYGNIKGFVNSYFDKKDIHADDEADIWYVQKK